MARNAKKSYLAPRCS